MTQNFAERLGWIPKSEDLRMSMGRALNFAQERKHTEVTLEHFLLALIDDPNAGAVFAACQINLERLRDEIEIYLNQNLQHLAALGEGMAQPSESFKKVMAHASAAAEQSQREVVDGAIVLAALIGEGQSHAAHILNNYGLTFDVVVNSLKNTNTAPQQQPEQEHQGHQQSASHHQEEPQPEVQQNIAYQEEMDTRGQPQRTPDPQYQPEVNHQQNEPISGQENYQAPSGGRHHVDSAHPQETTSFQQSHPGPQNPADVSGNTINPERVAGQPAGAEPQQRNIFDQKAYAAPGTQQQQAMDSVQSGLQDAYPSGGSENNTIQPGQQEQSEEEQLSGEATVEDILASVREIIGVENSEQETIAPLGGGARPEQPDGIQSGMDQNEIQPEAAQIEISDEVEEVVAELVDEPLVKSPLDDVYPSGESPFKTRKEEEKQGQPQEQAKPKEGLQDRLKEKAAFQTTEELAKNWPEKGIERSRTEDSSEPEKVVHENPFQPKQADAGPPPKPQTPPHAQQGQPPQPGPAHPQQTSPKGQPKKQGQQPPDNVAKRNSGPPPVGDGVQPPPHRNMPPPPPGQQGNFQGAPQQQRPHPNQPPHPGKGGPMPPPQGQPGQRGAPPPHMAGHPPPDRPPVRRPDPRMDGRPPAPGNDGQRQQGKTGVKGQLIENIPRLMRMGIPVMVEVRMARADVQEVERGMMGNNPPARHDVIVTEAMSVRLSAPKGGFNIALASPETQWIDNRLGGDNYASWKWTVIPLKSGKKPLQLNISARISGEKGVIAQSALPEQVVTVRVRVNYVRTFKHVAGWLVVAIAGGAIGKYSEHLMEILNIAP